MAVFFGEKMVIRFKGLRENENFIAGFWGVVREVNSRFNTCTVLMSKTQQLYTDIPVRSMQWVLDKTDYVPSERDLPPVGAGVFVCTPEGTIDSAFILCSGYFPGETSEHKLYAQNNSEKEDKNAIKESVSQGGWTETEDSRNGNRLIKSLDEKIKIELNKEEDSKNSRKKEISLIAWENEIHISEEGFSIQDKNKNKVVNDKDGLKVEDVNGNKLTMSKSGIVIEVKNGSKIEMTSTSTVINGNLEVLK